MQMQVFMPVAEANTCLKTADGAVWKKSTLLTSIVLGDVNLGGQSMW